MKSPSALHQTQVYPSNAATVTAVKSQSRQPCLWDSLGHASSSETCTSHAIPYFDTQECVHRSRSDCTTLQRAIAQYLETNSRQPDKAANTARYHMGSHAWRPVWRKNDLEEAGDFYTIRVVKGQRQVIKRRSAEWYLLSAMCMLM